MDSGDGGDGGRGHGVFVVFCRCSRIGSEQPGVCACVNLACVFFLVLVLIFLGSEEKS